ncbi:MAG: RlpA-like double-psi beta-barrel domain-containing protein [Chthoniobacterales bacterium]
MATWCDVPADSLARRRAGKTELTAASDHFKLGTLVRVVSVASGRSVVVRITDTGLRGSESQIDICREAAEQLGMVSKGVAKVRVSALPPETETDAKVTPSS